jgi:hypothetical protein
MLRKLDKLSDLSSYVPDFLIKFTQGKLNARMRKTAVCARVTGASGQYLSLAHPAVIPSATSCLIHGGELRTLQPERKVETASA